LSRHPDSSHTRTQLQAADCSKSCAQLTSGVGHHGLCVHHLQELLKLAKPSLLACRKRRNSYLCQYHQKLESVLSAHKDLKFAAHQSNQLSGELPAAPHTQKAVAVNCSS
jgi:hypothetical protein